MKTIIFSMLFCICLFACCEEQNQKDNINSTIKVGNNIQNYKYEKRLVEETKDYEKWIVFYDHYPHFVTTKHDTIVAIWSD